MADKEHRQQAYPLAPANGYARSDQEAASANSKELRRKKRMKCFLYIVAFAVFQIGIITLFAMTIMKFRTPQFNVRSAAFENFNVPTSNAPYNLAMNVQFGVKNTNFGPFKYGNTTVDFYYMDTVVGEVIIPSAKANIRATRKFNTTVNLSFQNIQQSDISNGILPLSSKSTLKGKVTIMWIMKKKKSCNMDCTMDVDVQSGQLQNIMC